VHWNMKALLRNDALDAALVRQVYLEPALVPAMPWLDVRAPGKPILFVKSGGSVQANWNPSGQQEVEHWVLQTRSGGKWKTKVLPAQQRSCKIESPAPEVVAVTAIGRYGIASHPAVAGR